MSVRKLIRPDRKCSSAENLLFGRVRQRQPAKLLEILFDLGHARTWPISTEQGLMCDLLQPREILQQALRWNAADVEINVGVPPHEKERRVCPQRTTTMREQDSQLGEIYGDIVNKYGIAVLVARTGKDRSTGVEHDGNAVRLGSAVDDFKFLHSSEIVVRK